MNCPDCGNPLSRYQCDLCSKSFDPLAVYQAAAQRTSPFHGQGATTERLTCCALAIVGEVGELCNEIKKINYHGHKTDKQKLVSECGDILWYVADMCDALQRNMDEFLIFARPSRGLEMDCLTLAIRAGWLAHSVKAILGGDALMRTDLIGRTRDVFAALYPVIDAIGASVESVAEANIDKLRKRYPDGFSSERSENRAE